MNDTWRSTLTATRSLLLFTLIATLLMALVWRYTKDDIAAAIARQRDQQINAILPASAYDNALGADRITLPPTAALGLSKPSQLYRARLQGKAVAAIFSAAAPDGYGGRIELILAVAPDGHLIGVRVSAHNETPGLGDYIDPRKDPNREHPWIHQFNGLSLATHPPAQWRLQRNGGIFTHRTGATISAHAVIRASARALQWITPQLHTLLTTPVEPRQPTEK